MPNDMSAMALGLSHSLARHKLKFSPDKIDTMIVQAIGLLDDLDKELNNYAMRVKEWYGWHFPELAKILNDNMAYAKVVLKMGLRSNSASTDLAEILPEEIEAAVKAAADRSMGTDISDDDLEHIQSLAEQVVGFYDYRQQLASYLATRMNAIAPNLTTLVGELVGARLIAHAGSLVNLSKSPASTIQILGAEKALFRALKTKHDTPKYGLIYHSSLIGQATGKNKGKMARVLAAKAAIGLRVDALAEWPEGHEPTEEERSALGMESRYYLEKKLAFMEGKPMKGRGVAIAPNGTATAQPKKWEISEARKYNPDADGMVGDEAAATAEKKSKKDKKRKLIEEIPVEDEEMKDADQANGAEESESEPESEEEEEKTPKKSKKQAKSGKGSDDIEALAAKAGLSVKRYQRKLERGEISFDEDGNPVAISKKDLKKAKKEAKKAAKAAEKEGKKRKRDADEEEGESKSEKKKKKKSKA